MGRFLLPFSFHFQPSELQRTTIGIISLLTIFIRGLAAVFHPHFSCSLCCRVQSVFILPGRWSDISARTISFEPGILRKLLNFPVKSHMASNMNLSIRISTFPLFTTVKLDRDMEQWEIGCHRSSLWKSCWDVREGGHPQLGPLCLAHLPPLQPPKWSGEGEITLWCILFKTQTDACRLPVRGRHRFNVAGCLLIALSFESFSSG